MGRFLAGVFDKTRRSRGDAAKAYRQRHRKGLRFEPLEERAMLAIADAFEPDDSLESSTIAHAEPDGHLGTVDFLMLEGEDLSAGDLNYQIETMHDGILTLEVIAPDPPESAQFRLYDEDPSGNAGLSPLAVSSLVGENQRIDLPTAAGVTYYVEAYGDNPSFDVRIANLVSQVGSEVTVYGTADDDTYAFDASAGWRVSVNGVEYTAAATTITFDTGGGNDTVSLTDSPGDDMISAFPGMVSASSADYTLQGSGFETLKAHAVNGGHDLAYLYDSPGDDHFYGNGKEGWTQCRMEGPGYELRMSNFEEVYAFANAGGYDAAELISTDSDVVESGDNWLRLTDGALAWFIDANGFDGTLIDPLVLSDIYVDADAPLGGAGTAWNDAFVDLASALEAAATLNTDADEAHDVGTIKIAEGTYTPTALRESGDARSASFSLLDNVSVIGGYAGYCAADPDVYAPETYVTTLSGDLGILDQNSDNAYSVVFSGENIEAEIDGVVISGGNGGDGAGVANYGTLDIVDCDISDNSSLGGGGIFNSASGALTVTNSTVSGNSVWSAGGGVANFGTLTLVNSTISANESPYGEAGGIYNSGTLTVTGSTVSGNSAVSGGGIYGTDGTMTVANSTISGNTATSSHGGIRNAGTLSVLDSWILDNATTYVGGGISNYGSLSVSNSTFARNRTDYDGGGIYSEEGVVSVSNSTFQDNSADYGGAICSTFYQGAPSVLSVTNSTFEGNSADHGGGIFAEGTLSLTNSAFVGNVAGYGGAICGPVYDSGTLTVSNSSLIANMAAAASGGAIYSETADVVVNNTLAWLNSGGDIVSSTGFSGANNLIGTDPGLVRDPSDGGDGWGDDPDTTGVDESANDDYGDLRLAGGSPAIDYGDNALLPTDDFDLDGDQVFEEPIPIDLVGNARISGGVVDCGVFEFQHGVTAQHILVTNTADSGPGSLREAIETANAASSPSAIDFQIPAGDPGWMDIDSGRAGGDAEADVVVILPLSPLPTLSNQSFGIGIDGTTQTDFGGDTNPFGPEIVLDGSLAGDTPITAGIIIHTADNLVAGLSIHSFAGAGIKAWGTQAQHNTIQGNYLGTSPDGSSSLGNGSGIHFEGGPSDNIIGGSSPEERNLISGNAGFGIIISGHGADRNRVIGNYIGTDITGTVALPNEQDGLWIWYHAADTEIGGSLPGEGNLISGNARKGMWINGAPGTSVEGNLIGVDASGTAELGNTSVGVSIDSSADVTVGGGQAGARNVISGNSDTGIVVYAEASANVTIAGNFIGVDASGLVALGNAGCGIRVTNASGNTIGGSTSELSNIISGNAEYGIQIENWGSGGGDNVVIGNYIGTDLTGTAALPNEYDGVRVYRVQNTRIGGPLSGEGNLISGNAGSGVLVEDAADTSVQGNLIGVDASGAAELGNGEYGISIDSAPNVTVGGGQAGSRNVISGNADSGIYLYDEPSTNAVIAGNFIGVDASGLVALGNGGTGIKVKDATGNTIGGSTPELRNIVSGNKYGISINKWQDEGGDNVVIGNYIGTDVSGNVALGNEHAGIAIDSPGNTVGGSTPGEGNVISGNLLNGIDVTGGGDNTTFLGNFIGTNAAGTDALGNGKHGIWLWGVDDTVVGGTEAGEGNIISGNAKNGIWISRVGALSNPATGTVVQGNLIGTNADGTAAIGNGQNGISIDGTANVVGGSEAGAGNVIAGNGSNGILIGVYIDGEVGTSNSVLGNFIGTDRTGMIDLGNTRNGIRLDYAEGNVIGDVGDGNVIAFNGGAGIAVTGDTAANNPLIGNAIFANGGLAIDLNDDGVTINDPGDADSGPNGLQNYPTILSVAGGDQTHVQGTLASEPNSSYVIHFYAADTLDPGGNARAIRYVGWTAVSTDANGSADFDITLDEPTRYWEYLVATATDDDANTSELSQPTAVGIAPLVVDTLTDESDGDYSAGDLSLREAIELAADETQRPGPDPIVFDTSLGLDSTPGAILLDQALGELLITSDVAIWGAGADFLTLDADQQSRVLSVNAGVTATIADLTVTGGNAIIGGGIANYGTLKISNATISANTAANGDGGGIYNAGVLTLAGSTLSENVAESTGGGVHNWGTLTITNTTFSNNSAHDGGGVLNEAGGSLEIVNSEFSGNSADDEGGGVYNLGTLTVVGVVFSSNHADARGGGVLNYGTLDITDSTFSNNSSSAGGGVLNEGAGSLDIGNSEFLGNSAGWGGGVYNWGTSNIAGSTFSNNSADWGGGVYNSGGTSSISDATFSNNSAIDGGGIHNYGTLTIANSSLQGNIASRNGGAFDNAGTATVIGSLLSGNRAYDSGAVHNHPFCTLTVTNSTLAGNSANQGGGFFGNLYGLLTLNNSILWQNDGGELDGTGRISASHNLIGIDPGFVRDPSDGGDGWGDNLSTVSIDESANDDYGDLRLTSHSPAIDYGDDALAVDADGNPLAMDLAGSPRKHDDSPVDVGAFEYQGEIAAGRKTPSLTVTTAEDVFDLYAGPVSLREAVYFAGTGVLGNTITFDAALDGETISLSGASLSIDKGITIDASMLLSLTIDAQEESQAFTVIAPAEDTVALGHLTITGGSAAYGGGIHNSGTLTVTDSTISGNWAGGGGGGVFNSRTLTVTDSIVSSNSADVGGGIHNVDTLTITNSDIQGNSSNAGGAIFNWYARLTITGSTLSDNSSTENGGGISGVGILKISGSSLVGNTAQADGGAIYSVYDGTNLTITDSEITGNQAGSDGGGVYSDASLSISGTAITSNVADYNGGGIATYGAADITKSIFTGNTAENGGAIHGSGTIAVTGSSIFANAVQTHGGGIYTDSGTVTVTNSSLANNSAKYGGGIHVYRGTLTVTNSTLAENSASLRAGGIDNFGSDSETTLKNTIVAGNSAGSSPDVSNYQGTLAGSHNLIGDGSGQTVFVDGADGNLVGTSESPLDPRLGEWTQFDNGLWGYRLLSDSPAIDGGSNALVFYDHDNDPQTPPVPIASSLDGSSRVSGGIVDMGAHEHAQGSEPLPLVAALTHDKRLLLLDVQDESGAATLVRDLTDTLPAGWLMGGSWGLSRGADGYLYTLTDVYRQGSWSENVIQWSSTGYVDSWTWDYTQNGAEGFGVTAAGDFLVGDGYWHHSQQPYIREYSRTDPASFTTYDYPDINHQGDDGLTVVGDTLYVAGCVYVAVYDIPSRTQTSTIVTAQDNSRVAVAADRRMAVNHQWFSGNPGQIAFIQVFAADGSEITRLTMPESYSADDVAFDQNRLGVLSWSVSDGVYTDPLLRIYDEALNAKTTVSLDGFGRIFDIEFTTAALEPTTWVTTLADTVDADDGVTSLREALKLREGAVPGEIVFAPTLFEDGPGTIHLNGSRLDIAGTIDIIGPGADLLAIDANQQSRVLQIDSGSTVTLSGITLTGGLTDSYGGGIWNDGTLTISDAAIVGNTAETGGGIFNSGGTVNLVRSTVSNNTADWDGGGISNDSGVLVVTDSTISDNSLYAEGSVGGGISSYFDVAKPTLIVNNSTISGNSAVGVYFGAGGGIYNVDGYLTVTNSTITDNSVAGAQGGGGGIYNGGHGATVTDSTISGNVAMGESSSGGGINSWNAITLSNSVLSANVASDKGGGVFISADTVTLNNSTLSGNEAALGGGIAISLYGDLILNNTIVALNQASYPVRDIYGDWSGGSNLVGIDPQFVRNPSKGSDGVWGTLDDDYGDLRLADTSIAINLGSNALVTAETDIAGQPRIAGDAADLGAYEHQAPALSQMETPSSLVTGLGDVVDYGDGVNTLREALAYVKVGLSEPAITFDSALFAGGHVTLLLEAGPFEINTNVTITGPGSQLLTLDAQNASRVFYVGGYDTVVSLTGMTITNGLATRDTRVTSDAAEGPGGLPYDSDLPSGDGGGIYSEATLTLADVRLFGNTASRYGGAVYNSAGVLTISDSVITGNTARHGGGIGGFNWSTDVGLSIFNSDISDNTASDSGGGIANGGILRVVNSTITSNSATVGGAAYTYGPWPLVVLHNSILAGNRATSQAPDLYTDTSYGLLESMQEYLLEELGLTPSSHNLLGDGTGQDSIVDGENGNIVGSPLSPIEGLATDSVLNLEVGQWGHFLLPGSPAIDAGDNSLALDAAGDTLSTDLLGNARIQDEDVDIGAYEGVLTAPYLSIENASIVEGDDNTSEMLFALTLSEPVDYDILIDYSTHNGTAFAGEDFVQTSGALTIAAGQTGATVAVEILGDGDTERNESFTLSLTVSTATIAASTSRLGTIANDDKDARIVTSLSDVVADDGLLSLREAIESLEDSYAGIITFAPTLFDAGIQALELAGSELNIQGIGPIEIVGPGSDRLAIDANQLSRVVHVPSGGTASIAGVTLTGGASISGGGVLNAGQLTLSSVRIVGNSATESGGGIRNLGRLSLVNTVLAGNTSDGMAGAIANYVGSEYGAHFIPRLSITNSTIAGNAAGFGAGIVSQAEALRMHNSIVSLNESPGNHSDLFYEDYFSNSGLWRNSNLIGVDPMFQSPPSPGADGLWGTDDDDYGDLRPAVSSIAIDRGADDLAVDAAGDALPKDATTAIRVYPDRPLTSARTNSRGTCSRNRRQT